jgi:hypothetical protein
MPRIFRCPLFCGQSTQVNNLDKTEASKIIMMRLIRIFTFKDCEGIWKKQVKICSSCFVLQMPHIVGLYWKSCNAKCLGNYFRACDFCYLRWGFQGWGFLRIFWILKSFRHTMLGLITIILGDWEVIEENPNYNFIFYIRKIISRILRGVRAALKSSDIEGNCRQPLLSMVCPAIGLDNSDYVLVIATVHQMSAEDFL